MPQIAPRGSLCDIGKNYAKSLDSLALNSHTVSTLMFRNHPSGENAMRSRTSLRRLAVVGTALATAGLLAACSGSGDSGNGASSSEPGPGITATTVKVGFIVPKPKTASGGTGFIGGEVGDAKSQVNALVKYVNGKGGLAGRKIDPVVRVVDSSTDSVQQENAVCTAFTQDDKVFAVVLTGVREPSARSCYAQANTLMIDAGAVPLSKSAYEELKPYLWAPGFSTIDDYAKALANSLKPQGFLDGKVKVGALIENEGGYQEAFDANVKPVLEAAGITDVTVAPFDATSGGTQGSSAGAAVNSFKAAGIDRLLFLGRPDMVGFFTSVAAPQLYTPRLAVGTFSDPNFIRLNPLYYPPAAITDAVGVGLIPGLDGINSGFPAKGPETTCINIYKAAGQNFKLRTDARKGLFYCDATLFLQTVANKIGKDGTLNAANFSSTAQGLGDSWQAAASLGTKFGEGIYAPASTGRNLEYDNNGNFKYVGGTFSLTGS